MGVATSLIEALKGLARQMGAWVIFVQADKGPEDAPAQAAPHDYDAEMRYVAGTDN